MKKTYSAPSAEQIAFDTEEILGISFTGQGGVLKDQTKADQEASSDFGKLNVDLF